MLEVEKPVQAVNISGAMQRALPLGTRKDFSEFLEVTPGVTARTFDQGTGGQVYMLRGGEIEGHVVQVDGADMGSFRQSWAGLYVGLSTLRPECWPRTTTSRSTARSMPSRVTSSTTPSRTSTP